MLLEYIKERYGNLLSTEGQLSDAAFLYKKHLVDKKASMISETYGFLFYTLEGDACIVWDIYVALEHRKTKAAWKLFSKLLEQLEKSNKRVIIGFSEKIGQNHADGVGSMLAAGFKPAFETNAEIVFIRGI